MESTDNMEKVIQPVKVKRTRKKKEEPTAEMIGHATIEEPVTVEVVEPAEPTTGRKKKYINNADLMKQIAISREKGKLTDELAKMLFMLCQRYAKHPDYSNIYSYKEDMEAFAMLTVVKVWKSFNPEKSNNPFAYFTQVVRHAFYQYLNHEKRQREVKDILLVDIGELPSFTYMENFKEERDAEYDSGFEEGEDEDDKGRSRRADYESSQAGAVTEINYEYKRDDAPSDDGTGN
jgi:DNA-directed RNA polymerase specialized sigma24 family protein